MLGASGEPGVDFTVPYPASVFELLVAVKLLELVDRGKLGLEDRIVHGGKSRALREWLSDMITWSDDESTRILAAEPDPCRDLGICYTQRIAGVGAAIDAALAAALERGAPR